MNATTAIEKLQDKGDTVTISFNPKSKADYTKKISEVRYPLYQRGIRIKAIPFSECVKGKVKLTVIGTDYKGPVFNKKQKEANTNKLDTTPQKPKAKARKSSKKEIIPSFVVMSSSEMDSKLKETSISSKVIATAGTLSKVGDGFFVSKGELKENSARLLVTRLNSQNKSKKYSCNKLKHEGRDIGVRIVLSKAS